MPYQRPARITTLVALSALMACGSGAGDKPAPGGAPVAVAPAGGELTAFQLQHGIGPITTEVTLGAPDHGLAEQGEKIFETKCSACHKMGEKYVGPPLGDVLQRRGPTFVMNMILNPDGMYSKHPETKKLLGEYMTQMPNQQLSPDDARAVVEYLRNPE
jgi:mono/diheme cytochrome c family protein